LVRPLQSLRTRVHGDYHLGQVLDTGGDFMILDFEGEPKRSIDERVGKRSPIVDVAGMLRSFDYAAATAAQDAGASEDAAAEWTRAASDAFLEGYLSGVDGMPVEPPTREEFDLLLRVFLLEKAIYEIGYEASYRPPLLRVPLRAALRLLDGLANFPSL
jgi:trehalose synthase-fused probable maltokinase